MGFLNDWVVYMSMGVATGLLMTLKTMLVASLLTIVWGLFVSILRMSPLKPFRLAAMAYIEALRGTPFVVQILILYATIPMVTGLMLPAFATAVLAIMLNQGSYMAESYRSGFEAVPLGQREAGSALGMSPLVEFWRVRLPLAIRVILPAIGNRAVGMLLSTPFVFMVGVVEMMAVGQMILTQTGSFSVYVLVTVIYTLIGIVLSRANSSLERALRVART